MRLIDAYALQNEIHKSKMKNPHKDPKIAKNHEFEHEHFMKMVVLQPTVMGEIVCCRNCSKYDEETKMCALWGSWSEDDGYCFRFEKQE